MRAVHRHLRSPHVPSRLARHPRGVLTACLVAVALLAGACAGSEKPVIDSSQQASSTTTTQLEGCNPVDVAAQPYHVATANETSTSIDIYDAQGAATPIESLDVPRMTDTDPPVEVPLVFLVVSEPEDDCDWMEVYLPTRPNFSTGWIKRDDVSVSGHDNRIEVSLGGYSLKFFKGDEVVLDVPIAVATEDTPTPGGTYYTTELLKPPNPDGAYGPYAFGLSGHSEVLSSFNGGQGQLGLHGTNQPERIGSQVSSGCIRLLNDDITMLAESADTIYGIPVQVSA